jgi:uncharacterized protein YggE
MTVRIGIQLPEAYEKKARRIARYKGIARASWIANLVQARIEDIYPKYMSLWEQDAKELGMEIEEFLRQLERSSEGED